MKVNIDEHQSFHGLIVLEYASLTTGADSNGMHVHQYKVTIETPVKQTSETPPGNFQ